MTHDLAYAASSGLPEQPSRMPRGWKIAASAAIMTTMFLLAWGATALAGPVSGEVTVAVVIEGVRSSSGTLRIGLFRSDGQFPGGQPDAALELAAAPGTVQGSVQLPQGTYAVAIFHDENGNERLDTNLLGIPREGVAFSNEAVAGMFGPPRFDVAAVSLTTGGSVRATVRY